MKRSELGESQTFFPVKRNVYKLINNPLKAGGMFRLPFARAFIFACKSGD